MDFFTPPPPPVSAFGSDLGTPHPLWMSHVYGPYRRSVRQDTGDIYANFFLLDSTEMIAIVVSLFTINRCTEES